MLQLPRVEWKLLACKNGASPDCIIVVVVVWDTIECVCMYTPHNAHMQELTAYSTHADLETWACALQESSNPSPGMNRNVT